jgi:phage repressor protein C with HTH and peptisase S24 domain
MFDQVNALDWVELPHGMTIGGDVFLVRNTGSTMEPRIWAGETRLVQRNVPPARDQDVVVEFRDGTATLKTFRTQRDGVVFVSQYNPDIEIRYDGAAVKALHAVFPL